MQYILTEDEFCKLVPETELVAMKNRAINLALALSKTDGRGCIHDTVQQRWYCDGCPAAAGDLFLEGCPIDYQEFSK